MLAPSPLFFMDILCYSTIEFLKRILIPHRLNLIISCSTVWFVYHIFYEFLTCLMTLKLPIFHSTHPESSCICYSLYCHHDSQSLVVYPVLRAMQHAAFPAALTFCLLKTNCQIIIITTTTTKIPQTRRKHKKHSQKSIKSGNIGA